MCTPGRQHRGLWSWGLLRCVQFRDPGKDRGERGSNRSSPLSRGGQGPLHTRTQSRNTGVKTAGLRDQLAASRSHSREGVGGARATLAAHPQPRSPNAQTAPRRPVGGVPQPSAFRTGAQQSRLPSHRGPRLPADHAGPTLRPRGRGRVTSGTEWVRGP